MGLHWGGLRYGGGRGRAIQHVSFLSDNLRTLQWGYQEVQYVTGTVTTGLVTVQGQLVMVKVVA